MKKNISIILTLVLVLSNILSFSAFALTPTDKECSYVNYNGETIVYYEQPDGETYILENGIKEYIAIPVLVEEITDPELLSELRAEFNKTMFNEPTKASSLPYSKTMSFSNTYDNTSILNITVGNFYMNCTNLNPSGAQRGFSYYVRFSSNGSTWYQALYVNKSLLFYTTHRMSDYGNGPYIQVKMWSYYGTVSTCKLHIQ